VTAGEFRALLEQLADAWAALDGARRRSRRRALHRQRGGRPRSRLFVGRGQLRAYFGPLDPGTYLRLDNVWFDAATQRGACEFTFGWRGAGRPRRGDRGRRRWSDPRMAGYLVKGPAVQASFLGVDGKDWRWHIGHLDDA
jgi:hypothetical protein